MAQLAERIDQDDDQALQIEYRSVDALIPYARNARTHSPAQVRVDRRFHP